MKNFILSLLVFAVGCAPHVTSNSNILSSSLTGDSGQEGNTSNPQPSGRNEFTAKITDLAQTSTCAASSWTSRGRAPAGYMKGMALMYARSLCRIKKTTAPAAAKILRSVSSGNAGKDVLAHYQDILAKLGLQVNQEGQSALHSTYSIGMGLGMRESSGKYCEGWDVGAGSNRPSAAAEAGLFQASYDSMNASAELQKIYDEYKSTPSRCLLSVFKEGVSCKASSVLGTGAGATFQSFVKQCHAFATEYAMTLIRILRNHFGPLNRKEAQVLPACDLLFSNVEKIVNAQPDIACAELF